MKCDIELFKNVYVMREVDINENKYYTPTIEEFHVGFEYAHVNSKNESGWEILSFCDLFEDPDWNELYFVNEAIKRGNVRVKYLDREDIESLGFEIDFAEGNFIDFDLNRTGYTNSYSGTYNVKTHEFNIEWSGYSDAHFVEDEHPGFRGTIKNKSELKVLLKQLGICYQS